MDYLNNNLSYSFFTYSFHYEKQEITNILNTFPKPLISLNKTNYNFPHKNATNFSFPFSDADNYIIDTFSDKLKPSVESELTFLNENLQSFFNGFIIGVSSGIKHNAIKNAYLYPPFIRLSNVNYHFIYTQFSLIEFIDGNYEFIISEEIPEPEKPYAFDVDITNVENYTKSALFSVRKSSFSDTHYHYGPLSLPNTLITYTKYILEEVIYDNFHIKLDLSSSKLLITSHNSIQPFTNKKHTNKLQYGNYYNIYRIGILHDIKDFSVYRKNCINKTFYYLTTIHLDNYILKHLDKTNDSSQLEKLIFDTCITSISKLKSSDGLYVSSELECLIKEKNNVTRWKLYNDIVLPLISTIISSLKE